MKNCHTFHKKMSTKRGRKKKKLEKCEGSLQMCDVPQRSYPSFALFFWDFLAPKFMVTCLFFQSNYVTVHNFDYFKKQPLEQGSLLSHIPTFYMYI